MANEKSLVIKIADRFGVEAPKLMTTLKATAFRQRDNDPPVTDEQMMALLIVADQYKLNPFTKEIYAYPDKGGIVPVVSVDGWTRIVNEHSQFDGVEFEYGALVEPGTLDGQRFAAHEFVTTKIYRKDRGHPIALTEYLDEVYRPPFRGTRNNKSYEVNGPWQTHTKRMHRHKSWIQCARLAFGFAGIYDEDEAQRIVEKNITDYTTVEHVPMKQVIRRASETKSPSAETKAPSTETNDIETTPNGDGAETAGPPEITYESLLVDIQNAQTADDLDIVRSINGEIMEGQQKATITKAINARFAEIQATA